MLSICRLLERTNHQSQVEQYRILVLTMQLAAAEIRCCRKVPIGSLKRYCQVQVSTFWLSSFFERSWTSCSYAGGAKAADFVATTGKYRCAKELFLVLSLSFGLVIWCFAGNVEAQGGAALSNFEEGLWLWLKWRHQESLVLTVKNSSIGQAGASGYGEVRQLWTQNLVNQGWLVLN